MTGRSRERATRRQATPERLALGRRIKEARKRLGKSQTDLAEQLDLTDAAVAQWEIGLTGPSIETLGKLPSVLCVSLDWLVWGKDTSSASAKDTSGASGVQTQRGREPGSDAVRLDAALVSQAYELGIDVVAALETRLGSLIGQARQERWLKENREALADANAFLTRHGLWSDGKRQF